MTEDANPTASLILGQMDLSYNDLPFREDTNPPEEGRVYRMRRTPYLYTYGKKYDHWNVFVEKFL